MAQRRRGVRTAAIVVTLVASSIWAAPVRSQPRVVTSEDAAAERVAVATETTALIGDFNGDRRKDLFWYGPGGKADHLWLGRADRNFTGVPTLVTRPYQPLVSDFNGDRRSDIFWYGPGAATDALWLGQPHGKFSARSVSVTRSYLPLIGDYNGDGRRDILWYGPGAAVDRLWLGRSDGRFTGKAVSVTRSYQPLIGDYNGDRRTDILWYGRGAAVDRLWLGRSDGRFTGKAVSVTRSYQPLIGDFNGDAKADIFWYGSGAAVDRLWRGRADGRFTGVAVNVKGTYRPFVGTFDGDAPRDIFWYAPGAPPDYVWYGRASGGNFSQVTTPVTRTFQPLVGDFQGDGAEDVLWWAPGTADDFLGAGSSRRRFSTRRTVVDLEYKRAVPLRPATIAEQFDPYGFVAHAFGSIDGRAYTNSLEAFERNYARGFRVFEVDHVLLGDGTAFAAHDHTEGSYGLTKHFRESTWADIVRAGRKYLGTYTVLRSQEVLRLMIEHPDIYIIGDFKYSRTELLRAYVRQANALGRPDLLERLFPHVATQEELYSHWAYYPLRNYVMALYMTQARGTYEDWKTIDFVKRNKVPAVMMWWRDRDPSLSLIENAKAGRRYRRSFTDALKAAGAVPYVHSLRDPAQVQRFWDLGIAVYSDEPFPPITAATIAARVPELQDPEFTNTDGMPPA
jgi:glycerophosphoryl diester phosphodiesterase